MPENSKTGKMTKVVPVGPLQISKKSRDYQWWKQDQNVKDQDQDQL